MGEVQRDMTEPRQQSVREEYTVRVRAPVPAVWAEIETIDRLLAHIEEVRQSVVDESQQSAKIRARLAWGPFGWTLSGDAQVVGAMRLERLVFEMNIPSMGTDHTGTFELAAASNDETNLRL